MKHPGWDTQVKQPVNPITTSLWACNVCNCSYVHSGIRLPEGWFKTHWGFASGAKANDYPFVGEFIVCKECLPKPDNKTAFDIVVAYVRKALNVTHRT